jgi:protein-tyrosine phosphatase
MSSPWGPGPRWIDAVPGVRLALMQRPTAGSGLAREISLLAAQRVDVVVSLLEQNEASELGLSDEEAVCTGHGIDFLAFPIADRGVPNNLPAFSSLVELLARLLSEGKGVVVHCRAGIGRSGLVAACVLLRFGVAPEEVFAIVSEARGLRVPDTDEQANWTLNFASCRS